MTNFPDEVAQLESRIARSGAGPADFDRLAALKLSAGDASGAAAVYREFMAKGGKAHAGLYNNLGAALLRAGQIEEAIAALQAALALQPGYLRAQVNLGRALCESGYIDESLTLLRSALAAAPDYVPALVNLASAQAAAGDYASAAATLDRALRMAPNHIEARATLGLVRLWSGDAESGITILREAISLAPEHADAHANLAHALFASGDWAAAWPHFEFRFQRTAQRAALKVPPRMPRWDGTIRSGAALWLVGEQGLGDQLQFARYAAVLASAGQRCVLVCEPSLVKILATSQLGVEVRGHGSGGDTNDARDARWWPLLSAPLWHATTMSSVPHADAYLHAEAERSEHWRRRMPRGGLRVALVWAGNPRMETGPYAGRSPPLAALEPLLAVPGVRFISLQKDAAAAELDALASTCSVTRFEELDAGRDAFLDSAAILKCVDLLITSDTAIAHLAGALGVPTWLCLMHEPDWRWMRHGAATPWYRSLRLFRQSARGDWRGVYTHVAGELRRLVAESTHRPTPTDAAR